MTPARPDFLVHWEPLPARLRSNLGPALRRSAPRWVGECEFPAARTTGMSCSSVLHAIAAVALVFAVAAAPTREAVTLRPFDPAQYEIRYVNSPYLPQMEDASGAESGEQGRAGGREAFHPRQVIRISRGSSAVDKVVEAPRLNLPITSDAVANVLVVQRVMPTVPVTAREVAAAGLNRLAPDVVPPTPDAALHTADRRTIELAVMPVPPSPDVAALKRNLDAAAPEVVPPTAAVANLEVAARTVDVPLLPVAPPPAAVAAGARADSDAGTTSAAGGGPLAGASSANGSELGGFVLSGEPGTTVGKSSASGGSLAMSPDGTGSTGLGGSGGGSGTGSGNGPGSGSAGAGPGSGATGSGRGNDVNARGGLTPGKGPGGTGSGRGPGAVPGMTIRGGTVTLGSFATAQPAAGAGNPTDPRNRPALTVVATARSGGALPIYGKFGGARVYTIYIDTKAGMAVLQYSEVAQPNPDFDVDITAPEPLHIPVPEAVANRILISCTLDEKGRLRDVKVLEGGSSSGAAPLAAALGDWIFRPAMRGETPIAVQAVLGFSIDTK